MASFSSELNRKRQPLPGPPDAKTDQHGRPYKYGDAEDRWNLAGAICLVAPISKRMQQQQKADNCGNDARQNDERARCVPSELPSSIASLHGARLPSRASLLGMPARRIVCLLLGLPRSSPAGYS